MAAKNGVLAGRYRLLHPARHDAVGTVWRAKDDLLDRYVTVKRLFPACPFDPAHSDRVRAKAIREARVALRLRHPHAVVVHDVFEFDITPYVVTEYLAAPSLADLIEQDGNLPPHRVAAFGAQLASALAAAHAGGIVHRGVGPEKVLITPGGTAKITDFGLGPAVFPAPGPAEDTAADVYALGATLYTALAGSPPAIGVPRPTGEPVGDVVLTLMRPEPASRPTMAEVEKLLDGLTAPLPVAPARGSRLRVLVAGAVLVVIGTAVTTSTARRRRSA